MKEATVADLMSREVVSLTQSQSVPLADALMKLARIRHLPVIDNEDRLVGLVTHRDLVAAQVSALTNLNQDDLDELQLSVPVSRIMQEKVWSVEPETSILEAARIMHDHRFGCLPVVDADQKLVGILTEADLVGFFIVVMERSRQLWAAKWT